MTRGRIFVGLILLSVACGDGRAPETTGRAETLAVQTLSQQAFLSEPPEDALLLDVRTPGEYAAGHVGGALNVPHDQLAARLAELGDSRTRPVVVYCKSGRRAGMAADVLLGAGYSRVFHLEGDMNGWQACGLPTVSGASPGEPASPPRGPAPPG